MKPTIRLMTRDDLYLFYGAESPLAPVVGIALVRGDEVLGIGGVIDMVVPFAFSVSIDAIKQYPVQILECARTMRKILSMFDRPVFACAEPGLESSGRFMRYIGFKEISPGVFVWA